MRSGHDWRRLADATSEGDFPHFSQEKLLEAQVLSLAAVGLKPRDIAERLGVNQSAVLRVMLGGRP
jgi:hypothetical protein